MFVREKHDNSGDKFWKRYVRVHKKSGREMTTIWHKDQSAVQDTSSKDAIISKFVERGGAEMLTVQHKMTIKSSLSEIADVVSAFMGGKKLPVVMKSDEVTWVGVEGGEKLLAVISYDSRSRSAPSYDDEGEEPDSGNELFGTSLRIFTVTAAGDRKILRELLSHLSEKFKARKYAKIKWWYKDDGRITYKINYMEPLSTQLRPEFYPTVDGGPQRFIKDYLKSEASILLLAGEPGTGKTTLLRHMLYENDLTASVIFDEDVMERDSVFQNFLFDRENDVLVIEDADKLLSSRTVDQNKLMSRFLNVSDGLIKLPNKKLIFTTNITDFSKVDEALLRPGRCFARVHTRLLSYDEAVRAAMAAGLRGPIEHREYSLAELFNAGPRLEVRKIGFVK